VGEYATMMFFACCVAIFFFCVFSWLCGIGCGLIFFGILMLYHNNIRSIRIDQKLKRDNNEYKIDLTLTYHL
jgi:hypothetical protein